MVSLRLLVSSASHKVVPKCNEDKKNPSFREESVKLCLRGGLFGMRPKSHIS